MKIDIKTRNFELTPAIEAHIKQAATKLEKHFHPLPTPLHITLSLAGFEQVAEAYLHLPRDKDIKAHATSDDMYTSIHEVIKKLDVQAIKHKEDMKKHGT